MLIKTKNMAKLLSGEPASERDIDNAMIWRTTKEGFDYWKIENETRLKNGPSPLTQSQIDSLTLQVVTAKLLNECQEGTWKDTWELEDLVREEMMRIGKANGRIKKHPKLA